MNISTTPWSIGHAKAMHDILYELDYLGGTKLDKRLVFNPLSELVDGNINVLKTTFSSFEWSNHVKPLA